MKEEIVSLWRQKADNDLKTGTDELATENPATDTVCFHMQQCVEKYLKAFLVCQGKEITPTHNVALLLQHCIDRDPAFDRLKAINVAVLTAYAVNVRYPDDFYMPTPQECHHAVSIAEEVKRFVAKKLT